MNNKENRKEAKKQLNPKYRKPRNQTTFLNFINTFQALNEKHCISELDLSMEKAPCSTISQKYSVFNNITYMLTRTHKTEINL
jgi:hypothetical protein